MYRTTVVLILTFLLVFSARHAARADEWPAVLRDAQAKCERQRTEIRDMVIVEDMVTTTDEGEITAEHTLYRKDGKSRVEMTMHVPQADMGDMKTIIIDDGKDVWMFHSLTGKRKVSSEEAAERSEFRDCWDFTPENSRVVRSETVDGHDCFVVEMTRDDVNHHLWLEKSTSRILQGESFQEDARVRWALSDFRKVLGDYEYPYRIDLFDGQKLMTTMTVKSITANGGLSDDLFDPDQVEMPSMNMEELLQKMFQEAEEDTR
ncbi:DUF4412 domain-containing protein [bacterium]|nr:DUF4412 domain-containing protein [bacterium]MBU1983112.1 DUF4412 domain-containing protein [bacterium]